MPVRCGIVLSTERMDRILEMDAINRNMRVEPGVLNSAVQKQASEHDLFWPPDPGSADYCTVGETWPAMPPVLARSNTELAARTRWRYMRWLEPAT